MVVTNQFGKVLIVFSLLLSVYGCVPNGTRTSFVTNDTCHIGTTGWVYRLNDFIVSGGRVIPRPQEIDSYHACSSQRNRDRVIESEKALSIDNTGYPHIRIEGEVCADIPTLVLEVGGAFLTPEQIRHRAGFGDGKLHQYAPYDFYVPWLGASRKGGYLNGVERSLIKFKAILARQCPDMPESVRVVGRSGYSLLRHNFRGQWNKDTTYTWKEVYTGSFDPRVPDVVLVHDDADLADYYKQYAARRETSIERERILREKRRAEGAAYFVYLMYGLYSSSPCNDPDLPSNKKPHWCD
ncbi:MAG: hypothetical protein KDI54_14340 [Gammaproteobacteria bacterium]|nr:hypothetical protein [Gammaproteobacteria bacterium]